MANSINRKKTPNFKNFLSYLADDNYESDSTKVIELSSSDDEIIFIQEKSQVQPSKEKDDDVSFINVVEAPVKTRRGPSYYANDGEVDEKEVLKRWRCKNLSNPKVNLSISNYRKRFYGEKNAKQAVDRRFKPFLSEIIKNRLESDGVIENEGVDEVVHDKRALNQTTGRFKNTSDVFEIGDQSVLDEQIEKLRIKYKDLEKEVLMKYKENKQFIADRYEKEKFDLKSVDGEKTRQINRDKLDDLFLKDLKKVKNDFEENCRNIKKAQINEIDAIKVLFKSGVYQKKKLSQYSSLSVEQPSAKRRCYIDDGHRQLVLPEEKLRAIVAENIIYSFYYGKP
jgi:hypothetical protein